MPTSVGTVVDNPSLRQRHTDCLSSERADTTYRLLPRRDTLGALDTRTLVPALNRVEAVAPSPVTDCSVTSSRSCRPNGSMIPSSAGREHSKNG